MTGRGSDEIRASALLTPTRDEVGGAPVLELGARQAARVGTWIDQYEVRGVLGHGAMGTVYRVRHQILGREYALKILDAPPTANVDARNQRFLREAQAAALLQHPNVVHVVYSGATSAGEVFLVMELLEGRALSTVIAEGPLAPERAAAIARQLALGLEAIHERGFLHRDLKPSNVMLVTTPAGEQAKILDLGLVGTIEPSQTEQRLTQDGFVMGTPMYMAPETFTHNAFTPQSDLYALGVVLHEMLAGRPPFTGSIKELLWHHCFSPPPPLAAARGLDALAARLLAKDALERPRSAREVVSELDRRAERGVVAELMEDAPARIARSLSRVLAVQPTSARGRNRRLGVALLASAVVGGAAVAAVLVAGRGSADRPPSSAREQRSPAAATPPVEALVAAPDPGPLPSPSLAEASPAVAPPRAQPVRPSEVAPSAVAPSEVAPSEVAPSEVAPSAVAPSEVAPSAVAPSLTPGALGAAGRARPRRARPAITAAEPREIMVTSEPPGARVETEAGILGITPVSVLVPGGRATTLTLHLDGHAERRLKIAATDRDPTVHVRLETSR